VRFAFATVNLSQVCGAVFTANSDLQRRLQLRSQWERRFRFVIPQCVLRKQESWASSERPDGCLGRGSSSTGLLVAHKMATEVAEWLNFLLRHIPGTIEVTPVIKRLTFESYSFPLHYGTLKAKTGAMQASQGWAALVVGWLHSFYHYGWRQIDCVKKPAATSGHCGLSSC
jgi:hypothetical protein